MIHLRKYNESAVEYISDKELYKRYSEIPTIIRLKRDLDQLNGIDRFKGNMQESAKKATFEIGRDFGLHGNGGTELFLDNEHTKLVIAITTENDFPGQKKDVCYKINKFGKQWYTFKLVSNRVGNWTEAYLMVYVSSDYVSKFLCIRDDNAPPSGGNNYLSNAVTNAVTRTVPVIPRREYAYTPPPPVKKVSIDDMKVLMRKIKDKRK